MTLHARPIPFMASATLAIALVGLPGGLAQATLSDVVVSAFRGKLVLARAVVPDGPSDKESIAALKAAQLTEVAGKGTDEGEVWHFYYTAFLTTTGNVGLKVRYVSGDRDRRTLAESAIPIPDVESRLLTGELSIGERQGLERGKAYLLQLVNDKGEVVAKTSAIFK